MLLYFDVEQIKNIISLITNIVHNVNVGILYASNIVHISLNTCGGSERLAITVMQALSKIGIQFYLTTFEKPNMFKLDTAYGKAVASVIQGIRKVNVLRSLEKVDIKKHYDLTINTHGDMLPYFASDFSKNNSITYCHFPLAKYLINSKDPGVY